MARVPDVKSEAIRDGHILDGIVETLAGVTRLQTPVRVDGPVDASDDLMLFHRLHIGINRRVPRVRLGSAEIHVFDEATRGHPRSRARRCACVRSRGTTVDAQEWRCRSDGSVVR